MTAAYDPRHDWALDDASKAEAQATIRGLLGLAITRELSRKAAVVNPALSAKVNALFAVSDYEAF